MLIAIRKISRAIHLGISSGMYKYTKTFESTLNMFIPHKGHHFKTHTGIPCLCAQAGERSEDGGKLANRTRRSIERAR